MYNNSVEVVFTKQSDGRYQQQGQCSGTHGRFQWLREDRTWDGGWKIEPVAELLARMTLGGPYKYVQFRILCAKKPEIIIHPCCSSCGLPGDVSKPYVVQPHDIPAVSPDGSGSEFLKWWDGDKWTGSPFLNAGLGQTVLCCEYVIDPKVKNAGHDIPAGVKKAKDKIEDGS